MNTYSYFIPQNCAPEKARHIAIYSAAGTHVGNIRLGHLHKPFTGDMLYRIGVLSDVHVVYNTGAGDFQRALTYLTETEKVEFI